MIPLELIEDYLIDQDEGVKRLLTWVLNLVMQNEALEQLAAERYQRYPEQESSQWLQRTISKDTRRLTR